MSFDESKETINALLFETKSRDILNNVAENLTNDLNSAIQTEDNAFQKFSGTIDSDNQINLSKIFFNSDTSLGYQRSSIDNNIVVFRINKINYDSKVDTEKLENFLNFINNTRSETEFYQFYNSIKKNSNILINQNTK